MENKKEKIELKDGKPTYTQLFNAYMKLQNNASLFSKKQKPFYMEISEDAREAIIHEHDN